MASVEKRKRRGGALNQRSRSASRSTRSNPYDGIGDVMRHHGIRHGKRPGGDKGQGEWRTVSQNYKDHATIDARWTAASTGQAGH